MRRDALLLVAILACGCGRHADIARAPDSTSVGSSAAAETPPVISDESTHANTLPEVLAQIQTERDALHAAQDFGAEDEVREHASAIGELVQGIPVMTPSVPLKRARRLDALVAEVEQHANAIEQGGEASDVTAMESALDEIIRMCAEKSDGE